MTPDELRAVHCELDPQRSAELADAWRRLGLTRLSLDVIECPDRRVTHAVAEQVAQELADRQTEVSVLIPRREYRRAWHRLLHDRTSDAIVQALASLPHCNVTVVPYHLGDSSADIDLAGPTDVEDTGGNGRGPRSVRRTNGRARTAIVADDLNLPESCQLIAEVTHRQHVRLGGRVKAMRVQPWSGVATLQCTVDDDTGTISVVFLGRRRVPGIGVGTRLVVEGVVGDHHGRQAILNPAYEILP